MAAGFLPRAFLQEPLPLPCCHRSLADGSQEPSREAPGPPSVPNLLPLGRSLAGGARAAVGWARWGPLAPLAATGQRGPPWLLSHLDVLKNPGRKCFLRTQGEKKEVRPDLSHLHGLHTGHIPSHILFGGWSRGQAPCCGCHQCDDKYNPAVVAALSACGFELVKAFP